MNSSSEPALFCDRLIAAVEARQSAVVVGLDPHLALFPPPLLDDASSLQREVVASAVERLCSEVIDAVADIAAAIKPQVAFFERLGPPGWAVLEAIVVRARERGLLVILDAKRGDIGSTASAYADYLLGGARGLGGMDADALTVNPYLGSDSLAPFADYLRQGKGLFVLAKTSNPASSELQDREIEGPSKPWPVYQAVAEMTRLLGADAVGAHGYSSAGIVVGATHPEQAAELRASFPELFFLVPGYGAQGAGPQDVIASFDAQGRGAVVNASRSIVFAYRGSEYSELRPEQWADACRRECRSMALAINEALASRTC